MNIINNIKYFLGYTWVALAITVSILGFKDMGTYEQLIAAKSGLHLSENWRGGKIDTVIDHPNYQTIIHQPVFAGFIFKPNKGFIQINWRAKEKFPRYINEKFDFNKDQQPDFTVHLDTLNNKASLKSYSKQVYTIKNREVLDFGNSKSIKIITKN